MVFVKILQINDVINVHWLNVASFLTIYYQGLAATHMNGTSRPLNDHFIANFLLTVPVKGFLIFTNGLIDYDKNLANYFFLTHSVCVRLCAAFSVTAFGSYVEMSSLIAHYKH